MTEEIIWNNFGVKIMNTGINIKICLYIVLNLTSFLKLLCSSTHTICKGSISGWNPASLYPCMLLFISIFFILTVKSSDRLHCLLRVDWAVVTCRLSSLHKLGGCTISQSIVISWNTAFILWYIICIFFDWRMLLKCGSKIRSIYDYISLSFHLLSVLFVDDMIRNLIRFNFWVWVNRGGVDACWILVKWFLHIVIRGSKLLVRVLSSHDRWCFFLHQLLLTNPSSRMTLSRVYHLFLR